MPTALLSVSDKRGLVPLASALIERGWTIVSTGGTAAALRRENLDVTEVSQFTGHPEIMDGRVKTLHPAVHSGLLGRRGHPGDERQMAEHGYVPIDLVAVNLYPFRETIAKDGISDADAIEQIDIGGPAMLRSAAKNHQHVWVLVDPADYDRVIEAIDAGEASALRRELAAKVFRHTSGYDAAIAGYLGSLKDEAEAAEVLAERIEVQLQRVQTLRYGENPTQAAGFYREVGAPDGLADLRQLHGKELSFNNLLDVDGALLALSMWAGEEDAVSVIVKHTTPCGVAIGASAAEAYSKALSTDPTSAFGSVVAFNRQVTVECAALVRPNFVEAIVAPGYDSAALELLREKKNLRLLELRISPISSGLDFKRVRGGFLIQDPITPNAGEWRVVSARAPTAEETADLRFAWRAVAAVKSNAIVLARGGMTVGIGAGQMSRVDSSRIAVMKARDNNHALDRAVLASDAFFPFRDGVDAAAGSGVTAVVQPGGSVRDQEVIAAADEHGLAMIFTGLRLFRH